MIRSLLATLILVPALALAETRVEVGPAMLSDEFSGGAALAVIERTDKWDFGIVYTDEQTVWGTWEKRRGLGPVDVDRNLGVFVQRHWTIVNIEDRWQIKVGLGIAGWQNTNRALGKRMTVPVSLEIPIPIDQFKPLEKTRWTLTLRHFSNAGSGTPNMGQDMIMVGFSRRL